MREITSFKGEFEFLSNFYSSPVEMEDVTYPTVEHAFQAAKTGILHERERVRRATTPGKAKLVGKKITLTGGPAAWNARRVSVMKTLIRKKFTDPDLRAKLLATGDATLIEGNTWNDKFWGVCNGVGENQLGKILMEVRAEILNSNNVHDGVRI